MIVAVDKATIQSFPGAGANPNKYVHSPRLSFLQPSYGALPALIYPLLRCPMLTRSPPRNPMCGRKLKVTKGKKSIVVTVVDTCPGCAPGSLDLTPAAFRKLAPLSVGRLHGIKWTLL